MRLAEREGAGHLVVACGVDIAEVEIRHGNFKSGLEWAEWAIFEYKRRGLNEHLRYKSAVATSAFANVLLGDEFEAARLLAGLDIGTAYLDVPGYEGIVSALGDVALVQGEYDRALSVYAGIHENAPLEVFGFTALSLVAAHIAMRDWHSATGLAETVFAVSRSSTPYERALGELVMGMALSETDSPKAESLLVSAISGLKAELHVAQAVAWLAIVRLRQGRRKDAVEALKAGSAGIAELGLSGWKLICAQHPLTEEVMRLWTQAEYEFEFNFLGGRKVKTGAGEYEPGLRAAEILAVLAIHATGLSGEQLHSHVYGEMPYPRSTLKASVSRLRDTVPIGSNPYRIDATFRADFIRVLDLISAGKLQRALNLYSGSLLPGSESPLIEEWREHVDESIRSAVLESRDPDHLIQLGTQLDDDLEIWESAKECLTPNDYRRPVVNARIRRIRASWER
jgi:tetratricopeptide (TPR) repeat protein